MEYRLYRAKPDLADCVECTWHLHSAGPVPMGIERLLADGFTELVINLGDPFERVTAAGRPIGVQPNEVVVGPSTRPSFLRATGRVDVVGVRLRPATANALLDIVVADLRDRDVDLESLGLTRRWNLRERLSPIRDHSARQAVLLEVLRKNLAPERIDPRIRRARDLIDAHPGTPRVDEIAPAAGTSNRTLSRLFHAQVGVSAKMFVRLARFRKVLHAAESRAANLGLLALEHGYFDQPHFLRDFREFTGSAPSRLLAAEPPWDSPSRGLSFFAHERSPAATRGLRA